MNQYTYMLKMLTERLSLTLFMPEGVVLVKNEGIKTKDIKAAEMVLEENKELAIEKWNEYFGRSVKDEDF